MIRPSLAVLTLAGMLVVGASQADPPRSCDITNPACPGSGFFPMVILVPVAVNASGEDPCFEREYCHLIDQPLVPVLACTVGKDSIQCQAWPRSLPAKIDVSPRIPILYRWTAQGDLSGGVPAWSESPHAVFGCTGKQDSFGIVQLEIMSPYGLISATSAATGCNTLTDEPVEP